MQHATQLKIPSDPKEPKLSVFDDQLRSSIMEVIIGLYKSSIVIRNLPTP